MNCLRPLEHGGHGFESHSRHGYLCTFALFVLPREQADAFRRAHPPSKESYRLCIGLRNRVQQRAIEPLMNEWRRYCEWHAVLGEHAAFGFWTEALRASHPPDNMASCARIQTWVLCGYLCAQTQRRKQPVHKLRFKPGTFRMYSGRPLWTLYHVPQRRLVLSHSRPKLRLDVSGWAGSIAAGFRRTSFI
jgi:hypothetical protein